MDLMEQQQQMLLQQQPQQQQDRDRSRRGDRPSRFQDSSDGRDRSKNRSSKGDLRLFVSNIPYEVQWMDLKDLFREHVGEVTYVELFHDENNKSRGCGIVEFNNSECVKKALEVMHRYPINGRKLVLKEDFGNERDKFGVLIKEVMKKDRLRDNDRDSRGGGGGGGGGGRRGGDNINSMSMRRVGNQSNNTDMYNTYGLSSQFLDSIGVQPPLLNCVFVANLDYKVDAKKLKEVFKMAGKVRRVDLSADKEGNSRGMAVVEYEHPVESVQAISMFNRHTLFERKMTVRMDRDGGLKAEARLPDGLKTVGLGLGQNGEPLRDIARNLPQQTAQTQGSGFGAQNGSAAAALNQSLLGAVPAANGLGAGALNLQALGLLQSQLLQQGLSVSELAGLGAANLAANLNLGANLGANLNNDNAQLGLGNNSTLNFGRNAALTGDSNRSNNQNVNSYNRKEDFIGTNTDKVSDMVIVSNIPPTMTWQVIREKFSECGDVKFAEKNDNNTAIVRFTREWEAERAIKKFDRTRIDGRTIDVRFY